MTHLNPSAMRCFLPGSPACDVPWHTKLPKAHDNDDIYGEYIGVNGSNVVFAGLYNETAGTNCDGITNNAQMSLYDVSGTLKWSKHFRASEQQTSVSALAVASDRICITEADQSLSSWRDGLEDYRSSLACYDLAGNQIWARSMGVATITSMRIDEEAGTVSAYRPGSWWTYDLASGGTGIVGSIDVPSLDTANTAVAGSLIVVLGTVGANLWLSVHDLSGKRLWEAAPRNAALAPELVGVSTDGTLYCTARNGSSEELLVYETGIAPYND